MYAKDSYLDNQLMFLQVDVSNDASSKCYVYCQKAGLKKHSLLGCTNNYSATALREVNLFMRLRFSVFCYFIASGEMYTLFVTSFLKHYRN